MAAMDHPASLVPVGIDSRHSRTLPCGIVRAPSAYLFLGTPYPISRPDLPPKLQLVLDLPPYMGLQAYAKFLLEAFEAEPDHPGLSYEYQRWLGFKSRALNALPIQHEGGSADHWLWTKPFRRQHPTMNYGGTHDVLVVRYTWALVRTDPNDLLPMEKNPLKSQQCPDGPVYKACVNPRHYEVAWEKKDPAPNWRTKPGLQDGRTTKAHTWFFEDGAVRCNNCRNPLSPFVQARYAEGAHLETFQHCPTCYSRRMDESGHLGRQIRGTRSLRNLQDDGPAVDNFLRWFRNEAAHEGKYNPALGQEVPTQDEEYLPTPVETHVSDQSFQDYLREVNDEDI